MAEPDITEVPIPVEANAGPIILKLTAKPAQVALVLRMTVEELIKAKIIASAPEMVEAKPSSTRA